MTRRKKTREGFLEEAQRPQDYREDRDIGNGSWILVKTRIPVEERVRPETYGIYWAIPAFDSFGRQKIKVYTPEECCLLNYEYIVLDEEKLEKYKKYGYFLHETAAVAVKDPLTLKLMEQGRSLCEEEREIIYALQLDGLDESAACEEYFLSKHTDDSNIGICYLPNEAVKAELYDVFGEYGIAG